MTQIDPIIAVKNVERSANWYQTVFECKNTHGGDEFAVLVAKDGEIMLCLHSWGEHEHPTMKNPTTLPGNGVLLYFRTNDMNLIRKNLKALDYAVTEEVHQNPNSKKMEFSVRDPDGYYLTVTEFHTYEG